MESASLDDVIAEHQRVLTSGFANYQAGLRIAADMIIQAYAEKTAIRLDHHASLSLDDLNTHGASGASKVQFLTKVGRSLTDRLCFFILKKISTLFEKKAYVFIMVRLMRLFICILMEQKKMKQRLRIIHLKKKEKKAIL